MGGTGRARAAWGCGLLALGLAACGEPPPPPNAVARVEVERCAANPLVALDASESLGGNVNGPSVIRVPDWVPEPLGRYYLYFGHHRGRFIRMAFADEVCGPWTVYEPGVLHLDALPEFAHHLASPDVHVDEAGRRIRLYFHGMTAGRKHRSGLAASADGLHFELAAPDVGDAYLKVFEWQGGFYGVAKSSRGWLLAAPGPEGPFERVQEILPDLRHAAVLVRGGHALVFHSRKIVDPPERIQLASIRLGGEPRTWRLSRTIEVLRPEAPYEGIEVPLGSPRDMYVRKHQVRDPAILEDEGRTWLFYSVAGEQGIAAAELRLELAERVAGD